LSDQAQPHFERLIVLDPIKVEHMLSSHAHLAAFVYASVYVGSLYISKNTRLTFASNTSGNLDAQEPVIERSRDDPDVIKARLLAVSIASALCCYAFAAYIAPDVRISVVLNLRGAIDV
jgi:hypothetical protein